jgi:hypothetical protein
MYVSVDPLESLVLQESAFHAFHCQIVDTDHLSDEQSLQRVSGRDILHGLEGSAHVSNMVVAAVRSGACNLVGKR